jgi:hypothetical protein
LSKFDQILDAAKGREKGPTKKSSKSSQKAPLRADAPKRRGRPATGKRNDPEYDQTTAYVRKDTYKAVRIALIEEGEERDYSELVEELLSKWLKSRK